MTIRPAHEATRLTAWEFFAGGGLAGLGLNLGLNSGLSDRFHTAFANDIDAAKARAFMANHPQIPFVHGDVWDIDADALPSAPDLIWASSPCQDVSLAGGRGGLAARRSGAFWGFWRLVEALAAKGEAPPVVALENVAGLLTSGGGTDFAAVCAAMAGAGYRVGALEMDAALWLPQSRPRLFVVAVRKDRAAPETGGPVAPFHTPRLVRAVGRLDAATRAAWAWWSVPQPARRNLDLSAVLIDDACADWLPQAETDRLVALMAPLHRARLNQALSSGERRVGAGFRRIRTEEGARVQRLEVRFDGLAGCLRTPAGGSSRQYVLVCEGGRVRIRRLTAREAARLMGVADDYRLPDSETAGLKLMGDAVAVPVVRALTEAVLAPAAGPS